MKLEGKRLTKFNGSPIMGSKGLCYGPDSAREISDQYWDSWQVAEVLAEKAIPLGEKDLI